MFHLKAVRETDTKSICKARSLDECAEIVRMLEDHDLWLEGYDAIATAFGGMSWLMTSDNVWERADDLQTV